MIRLTKTIGGAEQMWGTRPAIKEVTIADSGGGNKRDVHVVATTDDLDLDREVVIPSGADDSYFRENRTIFRDHQYTTHDDIGEARPGWPRKIMSAGKHIGWEVRFRIDKGEEEDRILEKFRTRRYGVSIGFEPIDYGPPTEEELKQYPNARTIIRKWRWIELSVTPLPCNVNARGSAVESEKSANPTGTKRLVVVDDVVIGL